VTMRHRQGSGCRIVTLCIGGRQGIALALEMVCHNVRELQNRIETGACVLRIALLERMAAASLRQQLRSAFRARRFGKRCAATASAWACGMKRPIA